MKLKKLSIINKNTKEIIRDIAFDTKIVLAVDKSSSDYNIKGNNVGKTTFLQIINTMLGAMPYNIYKIVETQKDDIDFKNFINTNIECVLETENIDGSRDVLYINFGDNKRKINDVTYKNSTNNLEYDRDLLKKIFNMEDLKQPRFSDLRRKYIRVLDNTQDQVFMILSKYETNNYYKIFYLFLFDFINLEVLNKYEQILDKWNRIKKDSDFKDTEKYKKELNDFNNKLSDLENRKNNLELTKYQKETLEQLAKKQEDVYKCRQEFYKLSYRMLSNKKTQKLLDSTKSNITHDILRGIYDQANILLKDGTSKSFEDMIKFNNFMLDSKKQYLSKLYNEDKQKVEKKKSELDKLAEEQEKLLKNINNNLDNDFNKNIYDEILIEIKDISKKKYKLEFKIESINSKSEEYNNLKKILDGYERSIKEFRKQYENNLNILNRKLLEIGRFCEISVNEILQFELNDDMLIRYKKDIKLGDGINRLNMLMFDLAYLLFTQEKNNKDSNYPMFLIQDRLEGIHHNSLEKIIEYIEHSTNGIQLISAVLSDKISESILSKYAKLELSQDDKLLKY